MFNRRQFIQGLLTWFGGLTMTKNSWPWAGHVTGDAVDAPYTNKYFADMFQLLTVYDRTTMGVVDTGDARYAGGLQVNAGAGFVTVQTGVGISDGMWVTYDAPFNLTPDNTPSVRTDLVVIRKTVSVAPLQEVNVVLKKGTDGSSVPPALTQNLTMWEIPLAEVPVTPGPTIGAVVNVAVAVRTPLGPGYKFASLATVDAGPRATLSWEPLDPPVVVSIGPGPWSVNGTLNYKAQTGNGTRFARIYNNTLAKPVTWGNGYGVVGEGACIQMAEVVIDEGVVCELELQIYSSVAVDDVYGDDNPSGPSTSIIAKRII